MKLVAIVLALLAVGGMVFGWWGLETVSGRRQFDEMAGIIPLLVGVGSMILLMAAGILYFLSGRG